MRSHFGRVLSTVAIVVLLAVGPPMVADSVSASCDPPGSLPAREGPEGITCRDGIDNDCDGLVDLDDPQCGASRLSVRCALRSVSPPVGRGTFSVSPGNSDCLGWYQIEYDVEGASAGATVMAELLAVDDDGNIVETLAIGNGGRAFLGRIPEFSLPQPPGSASRRVRVTRLLRVTADDGSVAAQAFCSPVPFLQVIGPTGRVVSESRGAVTKVTAAVPRVDPASLTLEIDGIDVLGGMGIVPGTDFPGGPFDGQVRIRDRDVAVTGLIVGTAAVGELGSNTLAMTLSNLGAGAHILRVGGRALPSRSGRPGATCVAESLRGIGTVSVFGIRVDSPEDGEIVSTVPTPVTGVVRHGRPIRQLAVNGVEQETSGQVLVPGDGVASGDEYVLSFEAAIDQTNLALDLANLTPDTGTFDPGSNRLIVSATDDRSNRTFLSRHFAIGPVIPPAPPPAAEESAASDGDSEIPNAVVLGVGSRTLNAALQDLCDTLTPTLNDAIRELIEDFEPREIDFTLNTPTHCDPTVSVGVNVDVTRLDNLKCSVTFESGLLTLNIEPQVRALQLTARGECGICVTIGSGTIQGVSVGVDVDVVLNVPALRFSLRDWQNELPIDPDDEPHLRFLEDSLTTPAIQKAIVVETRVRNFLDGPLAQRIIEKVVDFLRSTRFQDEIDTVVNLSAITVEDVRGWLAGYVADFVKTKLEERRCLDGSAQGDACSRDLDCPGGACISIREERRCLHGSAQGNACSRDLDCPGGACISIRKVSGLVALDSFTTTPAGVSVTLKGRFSPSAIDPEIEAVPGAQLSPAAAPGPGQPPSLDTFMVVADDTFDQLLAALTQFGDFTQGCRAPDSAMVPRTVGELLPPCGGDSGLGSGICVGIRGGNCESLGSPVDQGACHGVRGHDCARIPVSPLDLIGAERAACRNVPIRNISADMPILYCGRADVPPSFWIRDDLDAEGNPLTTPDRIESFVRVNDMVVAILIDRQSDGIDGPLPALAACSDTDADPTGDCVFYGTCLDINILTDVLLENAAGQSSLNVAVNGVRRLDRPAGTVCQAGVDLGGDNPLLDQSRFDALIDGLLTAVDEGIPELVQLPGIPLPLTDPELIAVRTSEARPGFDDYLGLSARRPGPPDPCGNGVCDAGETCGLRGPDSCLRDCGLCPPGEACETRIDCDTGICVANLCIDPSGGFSVGECDDACLFDPDCLTGVCNFGFCTGRYSLPALRPCSTDLACRSRSCRAGLCEAVCGDGFCDGTEVCGADDSVFACRTDCGLCPAGRPCTSDAACRSGSCRLGLCESVCGDGFCDGTEVCGAVDSLFACRTDCGLCPNGHPCSNDDACQSGFCVFGICGDCRPIGSACLETPDCCGSSVCNLLQCIEAGSLPAARPCSTDAACRSGSCLLGLCESVCGDGFCDGSEVCGADDSVFACRTDCGRCPNGHPCLNDDTCQSRICWLGTCRSCRGLGAGCSTNSECCSENCFLGFCT